MLDVGLIKTVVLNEAGYKVKPVALVVFPESIA